MKYIKRIDELKSEVYNRASAKLSTLGHNKRSTTLAQYGNDIRIKEVDAEQEKALSDYRISHSECVETLANNRVFKLNIPDLEIRTRQGNSVIVKKETIELFDNDTEFYFHSIFCDEQDMEWDYFIENVDSDITFRFVVMFSYIRKDITREYKQGVHAEISRAYIDTIEAFSIVIDTHTELGELYRNLFSEDAIFDRTTAYVRSAYCYQIGRDILISLNNRSDARFILDKLKQTMVDSGPIFKGLYNKFKKQEDDEFNYHLILPALQRAINNKVTLNMLYRDTLQFQ